MKKKDVVTLKIIMSVLFMACLFHWPYGYYQIVRLVGVIGFGFFAYKNYKKNNTWFIIWLCSAILINPIVKFVFGKGFWNFFDVIWAILLIASIFIEKPNEEENDTEI